MNDNEKRIIIQAYTNLQLAAHLQASDRKLVSYDNSELGELICKARSYAGHTDKDGIHSYKFVNQGVVLTSLWGLLVHPREIIDKSEDEQIKKLLKEEVVNMASDWSIPTTKICWYTDKSKTFKNFLRHIRNAISHNNVEPVDNSFVFKDFNKKNRQTFEITFTAKDLFAFLEMFYRTCCRHK